jgi:hypothetical protein
MCIGYRGTGFIYTNSDEPFTTEDLSTDCSFAGQSDTHQCIHSSRLCGSGRRSRLGDNVVVAAVTVGVEVVLGNGIVERTLSLYVNCKDQ